MEMIAVERTWARQRQKRREQKRKQAHEGASGQKEHTKEQGQGDCQRNSDNAHGTNVTETNVINSNSTGSNKRKIELGEANEQASKRAKHGDPNVDNTITDASTTTDNCSNSGKTNERCTNVVQSDMNQASIEDVEHYLFKCHLQLTRDSNKALTLQMDWMDGENKELMHQVMQYFKNHLK